MHDPRRGADLHSRFSLDGNPDLDKDWTTNAIEYVEDGATKLMEVPLTPADFALDRRKVPEAVPASRRRCGRRADPRICRSRLDERAGKKPFVWSTDDEKKLIKVEVSPTIVHLVQERRKNWRTLQYLAGLDVEKLDADHHAEVAALKRQCKEAMEARESSIDSIARAMSELAASSNAPPFSGSRALRSGCDAPDLRPPRRRPGREGKRIGAGYACRRGCRQVHQLQDLLSGDARNSLKRPGSSSTASRRKWVTSFPAPLSASRSRRS